MNDMLFSERTLRLLSEDELAGVCAHEAAHLTESVWVFGGRLTAIAGLCPLMLIVPVINRFGLLGVMLLLLAAIGLMYLPIRLARRMEKRADAAAVRQTPDPAVRPGTGKSFRRSRLPARRDADARRPDASGPARSHDHRRRHSVLRTPGPAAHILLDDTSPLTFGCRSDRDDDPRVGNQKDYGPRRAFAAAFAGVIVWAGEFKRWCQQQHLAAIRVSRKCRVDFEANSSRMER